MKFSFGKSKKQLIVVSIVLSSIIAALSQCTEIHENNFWDILDEIQRKYFPQTVVGRVITESPDKVERRVKRDVDTAIRKALPEYEKIIAEADKKYKPLYMDLKNDEKVCYTEECKSLVPPMRICAPWVDDCIKK